jgi:histidine triad (HIT) family protein
MLQLGLTTRLRTHNNPGADGQQEVQPVPRHVMGGPRPWAKG